MKKTTSNKQIRIIKVCEKRFMGHDVTKSTLHLRMPENDADTELRISISKGSTLILDGDALTSDLRMLEFPNTWVRRIWSLQQLQEKHIDSNCILNVGSLSLVVKYF